MKLLKVLLALLFLSFYTPFLTSCGGGGGGGETSSGETGGGETGGGETGGGETGGGETGGGGGTGNTVNITVYDTGNNFYKAVYQVEDGSWQVLNLTKNGDKWTGSFNANDRYGFAVRCDTPNKPSIDLYQLTTSETTTIITACPDDNPPSNNVSFTVNVNVSGISNALAVCVNDISWDHCDYNSLDGFSVTLQLPPGNQTILVGVIDTNRTLVAAKAFHDVNVTDNGSTTVDITQADQLPEKTFTPATNPDQNVFNGGSFIFYLPTFSPLYLSDNTYRPVSGFDSNLGDMYVGISRYSYYNDNTGKGEEVGSYEAFTGGSPILSVPDRWSQGSLTIDTQSHPIINGLSRTENDLLGYYFSIVSDTLDYEVTISKNWIGNSTSYTFPDLSSLLEYTPLSNGSNANISITAYFGNVDLNNLNGASEDSFYLLNQAGNYIKFSGTESDYTVGSGQISLP